VYKKERGPYSLEPVKERLLLKSGFVQLAQQDKLISVVYFSVFASRKGKEPFFLKLMHHKCSKTATIILFI